MIKNICLRHVEAPNQTGFILLFFTTKLLSIIPQGGYSHFNSNIYLIVKDDVNIFCISKAVTPELERQKNV